MTEYKATDKVSFTVSARGPESTSYRATRDVDSIKEEINKKVNPANELVRDEGLRLVGSRSGAQRIDQICSIYDYIVGNWTFVSDPRGLDVFQYANYTLKMGKDVVSSGKGDCDDFSILLASLVESIGGTPRIILAYSPATGGHAYTEVYLGNKSDKDVNRMLSWLRTAYNVSDINIHTDPVSGDVWLNMDWWKDPGGANHPGGPFYQTASQVPIYIQEEVDKTPLTPIENLLPRPLFNYSPLQPEVDEVVRFDASESTDPDGKIVDYKWDFGDGDSSNKSISQHIYQSAGKFQARLKVTDNEGDSSIKALVIDVKEPLPEAIGTYSPVKPKVGDVITFDASQSKDKRGGQITEYEWDFGDGYSGKGISIDHQYLRNGTYNVKLTVTSDRSIQNASIIAVVVGQSVTPVKAIKVLFDDEAINAHDGSIGETTVINLSGKGNGSSQTFSLNSGLTIIAAKYLGSSKDEYYYDIFSLYLMNPDGTGKQLLFSESKEFNGSRAIGIFKSGDYRLFIPYAGGSWTANITQPRPQTAQAVPVSFTGKSSQASELFSLKPALTTFRMTNNGYELFFVRLLDLEGNVVAMVLSEDGPIFDASKEMRINNSGIYCLDIQANGDWKVDISQKLPDTPAWSGYKSIIRDA